jgi:uncharacterized protein
LAALISGVTWAVWHAPFVWLPGYYDNTTFDPALSWWMPMIVLDTVLITWVYLGTKRSILAALVFSAFHYVGPYGDPLRLGSFTFRFLAGLALSGLYVLRGFGVTAWTHALYNVFLLLAGLR